MSEAVEVEVEQSQEDFAKEFFSSTTKEKLVEEEKEEVETPAVEDVDQTETQVDEDLGDDTPAEEDDEDEEEVEEAPKKKNRFQERINELTADKREAERKFQELEATVKRLSDIRDSQEKIKVEPEVKVQNGPSPDDQNEDGTDKYPLGEFDPKFNADIVRHTLKVERELYAEEQKKEQAQAQEDTQRAALQTEWNKKLEPAKERYPDFQDKVETVVSSFSEIDPAYGEYLSVTLMDMDFGTDVLYYLGNNLDEAKKIVESGPAKASVALGRIESKFMAADEEKQKARPKVSNAPVPPSFQNKGSAPAKTGVSADTDDLEAFTREFFKKK
jgi:hypothetical protein